MPNIEKTTPVEIVIPVKTRDERLALFIANIINFVLASLGIWVASSALGLTLNGHSISFVDSLWLSCLAGAVSVVVRSPNYWTRPKR